METPGKDIESMLASSASGDHYLETMAEWHIKFTGATPERAEFTDNGGYCLTLFTGDRWTVVGGTSSADCWYSVGSSNRSARALSKPREESVFQKDKHGT